jgi:phosphotriesterase-related protein
MPIHTVLGPIDPAQLGVTSMHEHLLIDCRVLHVEPDTPPPAGEEVRIENLGWLHWNNQGLADNLVVDDDSVVATELEAFAAAGGSGVVDMTNIGLGRRVERLPEIARRSGAQVMIGCGWYLHPTHPPEVEESSPERLAELIVGELTDGVGETGVRPALIGEIGSGHPVTERERKVLRAAAWAAVETAAAVNVHVEPAGDHGVEIARLLIGEGMAPERVVLSHMDERLDLDYHLAVAATGVVLEFDTFGMEAWWKVPDRDPTDGMRFARVAELIRRGHLEQLVLGCDVFTKTCHRRWGGQGYQHLPARVAPMLRDHHGVAEEELETMLVRTPRRLLDRP